MKISIVRSGGFAGITMPAKILETEDPCTMDEARWVIQRDYKDLMGKFNPDGMEYKITVEENGKINTVIVPENDDTILQSLLKSVL